MEQSKARAVINFTDYIVENTRDFTRQEWVFQTINDWLADPYESRFFYNWFHLVYLASDALCCQLCCQPSIRFLSLLFHMLGMRNIGCHAT